MIRQITIRFDDVAGRSLFDVADDAGRIAESLTFDEMLGQITSMTFPLINRSPLFRMRTVEERDRERMKQASRVDDCTAKEYTHG